MGCALFAFAGLMNEQSAHTVYVITFLVHMSSEDPRGANAVSFFFFCLHRSFLPTLFLFCHVLFSLLQPFVIHDMKSLMEGEQFINCKQLPNQEHQPQTSALTFGHGG